MEENQESVVSNEPQTTADVVSAEFDKLESAEVAKTTDKTAEDKPTEEGRARDEQGKFAKKPEDAEKPVDTADPSPGETPTDAVEVKPEIPTRNPYQNWRKEDQVELVKLPENIQGMIQRREAQLYKGLQQYREEASSARTIKSALSPFDPYLKELGVTADQAIPSLLSAERTLRKGSQHEKTQMLMQLAHDYGVDVNTLAQTPFNPVEYQLRQQLSQLQGQVASISQSRQVADEANLGQTIEQFAQGKEYFDEVRETMADLLDKGLANDLDDAYTKALRLNDDVFQKWNANQHTTNDRQRLEQANNAAKAAKAAAVSVKGSPTGVTRAPEPKTTEDAVRQAMANLGM